MRWASSTSRVDQRRVRIFGPVAQEVVYPHRTRHQGRPGLASHAAHEDSVEQLCRKRHKSGNCQERQKWTTSHGQGWSGMVRVRWVSLCQISSEKGGCGITAGCYLMHRKRPGGLLAKIHRVHEYWADWTIQHVQLLSSNVFFVSFTQLFDICSILFRYDLMRSWHFDGSFWSFRPFRPFRPFNGFKLVSNGPWANCLGLHRLGPNKAIKIQRSRHKWTTGMNLNTHLTGLAFSLNSSLYVPVCELFSAAVQLVKVEQKVNPSSPKTGCPSFFT